MMLQVLHCPHGHGTDIVRHGQTRQGKQRYRCREKRCAGRTFLLEYSYRGQSPAVKEQIVAMALNASGIRQTPPDLVVKFQPIDIVGVILWLVLDRALCINGKSRAEPPST
jgi:transposase-like protein